MLTSRSRTAVDRPVAGIHQQGLTPAALVNQVAAERSGPKRFNLPRRSIKPVGCNVAPNGPSQLAAADTSSAVDEAWRLLLSFNEADMRAQRSSGVPGGTTKEQRDALRKAVLVAVSHPWPEAGWDPAARPTPLMLGVLSGDVRLAVRALRDYAQALGFDFVMPQSKVPGQLQLSTITNGVYIKHRVSSASATVSEYSGSHRGVLLQLGQQQIGHLPLGLFDEAKSVVPPCVS